MSDKPYRFGYQPTCHDCRHQHRDGLLAGRVSPCGKVAWIGQRHVVPSWEDGRCMDHQPIGQTTVNEPA